MNRALSWLRGWLAPPAPTVVPVPTPAPGPRISSLALAGAGAPAASVHPYELPTPAPRVVPEDGATMAMDDAITDNFAWARTGAFGYGERFPGYAYLAELAQRPEYRRISETVAKEMTRKWVKLQASGSAEDGKAEKLKQLDQAMRDFKVPALFRRAAEHDGFFGRGQIFIDTGASPDALPLPLVISPATVKKDGLKGLRVVEPMWTYPNDYDSTNPMSAAFYKPRTWFVMGQTVHASRLLTFVGREVPDLLKPAYSFGGLSMSQMAQPYVENWLRTRQSVSDLLHSFSVSGVKTNMSSVLAGEDGEDLAARAVLFNKHRDNRGLMFLDKETEEFFNVSTPLSTLDKLQAQSQEQMASVAGIPLVKLLGITPSGLNASSDGEIRVFYDWIEAQQEQLFTDNLTVVVQLLQLHLFGEIDPEITFAYVPLWQLDEVARATVRKTNAEAAAVQIDHGVLDPDEERERLAREEDSLYPALDLNRVIDPPEPDPVAEPEPAEAP